MRLFIVKSQSSSLSAFAADSDARALPAHHRPWHAVGLFRPEEDPPYDFERPAINLERPAIEQAIAASGYRLLCPKKKSAA
jgi:hypothetical protein